MWFKHSAWVPVAWLLSLINVAAVWFAAAPAEPMHATIHALLGAGFGVGAMHLTVRGRAAAQREHLGQVLELNEHLQQTVDDMQGHLTELEERVDFAERLLATHREPDRRDEPPG